VTRPWDVSTVTRICDVGRLWVASIMIWLRVVTSYGK
jgi:hypothetical protein